MANTRHLDFLTQGVEAWNRSWREKEASITPDLINARLKKVDLCSAHLMNARLMNADLRGTYLINADLSGADLSGADLSGADLMNASLMNANLMNANLMNANLMNANLVKANLSGANLSGANLSGANLTRADLVKADLMGAKLRGANLKKADLNGANLNGADLSDADLSDADLSDATFSNKAKLMRADLTRADLARTNFNGADLTGATLIRATFIHTDFTGADLTQCKIFGSSAWDLHLGSAVQKELVITDHGEPKITVDNIEVAQFIYLLLNNQKLRAVINTITSKLVLLLGRFTKERKPALDTLRNELRKKNYLPVVFDFEKPDNRSFTETIRILAPLSSFIIADLTDASSVPQELASIIPDFPSVFIQPIIHKGYPEYSLFKDFEQYPWVLPIYCYEEDSLVEAIEDIITPVEKKKNEEDEKRALRERLMR